MTPTVKVGPDYLRLGNQVQVFGVVCEDCRHRTEVTWCDSPKHPNFDSWEVAVTASVEKQPKPKAEVEGEFTAEARMCPKCWRDYNSTVCPVDGVGTLAPEERAKRLAASRKAKVKKGKR